MALFLSCHHGPHLLPNLDLSWVTAGDTFPLSVPPASTTPEYPWGSDDAIPPGCCCYPSEPGSRKGPSDLAGPWRGASASQELKQAGWW